jgi:hypothetical protein
MMGDMKIPDELIDQLLGEYRGPEQLTGPEGLINRLRRRLIERVLGHDPRLERGVAVPGQLDRDRPVDGAQRLRRRPVAPVRLPFGRLGAGRVAEMLRQLGASRNAGLVDRLREDGVDRLWEAREAVGADEEHIR